MTSVVIIDYGSGNLRSAAKAFEKVGGVAASIEVTSDPKALASATHIVLPGVGAFGDCMKGLMAISGMIESMEEQVLHQRKPFLGICVGMQLLAEEGHEHGIHKGLGWIKGAVVPIEVTDPMIKVPHMGWNNLSITKASHPLLAGIKPDEHAYFVHSYYMAVKEQDVVLATTHHGIEITAIISKNNIMATQFHPEKSQHTGQMIIANFLKM